VATPGRAVSGNSGAGLPYELQQVARQFPVTLYTAPDCNPCAAARNLLVSRGVPFTERTINSNEDIDALRRISGEGNLPFGTIGGQQLKGFSDVEWTQYLDAAAYPKTSQLPPSYRAPAPTPLVAVRPAETPAAQQPSANTPAAQASPQPQGPSNSNPTGIQF
jgi:glutaredoxin